MSIIDGVHLPDSLTFGQWDEKIGDAINYLVLLEALLFEGMPPEPVLATEEATTSVGVDIAQTESTTEVRWVILPDGNDSVVIDPILVDPKPCLAREHERGVLCSAIAGHGGEHYNAEHNVFFQDQCGAVRPMRSVSSPLPSPVRCSHPKGHGGPHCSLKTGYWVSTTCDYVSDDDGGVCYLDAGHEGVHHLTDNK